MTDEQEDAGIGRLASRYSAINRRVDCLKNKLKEASQPAYEAAIRLRCGPGFSATQLRDELTRVDWQGVLTTTDALVVSEEEKKQVEACLRRAGLDNLIRGY